MHTPPPPTTKQVHRRVTFVELPEANSTSDETKSVVDSSTDASSSHAGVSEVEWDHTHSHPLMGDKWLTGRVRSKEEKNTLQGYGARESTLQVMDTMAAQVEMLQGLAAGGRSSPSNLRSPYVISCLFMFRALGVRVWCCRFANQSVRRNENTALKNDAPLSFEHLPPPPPPPSPPLPPLPPPPHTHTHTHTHTHHDQVRVHGRLTAVLTRSKGRCVGEQPYGDDVCSPVGSKTLRCVQSKYPFVQNRHLRWPHIAL
jgi:hypothetical protein